MPLPCMPARAVMERFQDSDDVPSWAAYIRSVPRPRPSTFKVNDAAMKPLGQPAVLKTPERDQKFAAVSYAKSSLPVCKNPLHISNLRGHVWELSQDAQGSRSVQGVIQEVESSEHEELALELRGHIMEAARCPHANFVLQKCICHRTPKASHVIALELIEQGVEGAVQAAKHRYGCRIVQRLLEFGTSADVDALSDLILSDAKVLCAHPYGNYTMQHVFLHGSDERRQRLANLLREEAPAMAANFHASAVIGEALRRANRFDATELARALLQEPGLLSQMARTKHGHVAARLAMQALDPAKTTHMEHSSDKVQ